MFPLVLEHRGKTRSREAALICLAMSRPPTEQGQGGAAAGGQGGAAAGGPGGQGGAAAGGPGNTVITLNISTKFKKLKRVRM